MGGGSHILVVEDDAAIADMLVMLLQMEGYVVTIADSGAAAMSLVADQGAYTRARLAPSEAMLTARPDLILLDLQLPDMDGEDVIKQWQHTGLAVPPVIVLTARREQVAMDAAHDIGAAGVFLKPFEIDSLLDQIGLVLTRLG